MITNISWSHFATTQTNGKARPTNETPREQQNTKQNSKRENEKQNGDEDGPVTKQIKKANNSVVPDPLPMKELLFEFFSAIASDPRISINHIGLYAALLQCWQAQAYKNPMRLFSAEMMSMAKISASTTYYKIIKDLSHYGYIKYEPSFKRNKGSKVFLIFNVETQQQQKSTSS